MSTVSRSLGMLLLLLAASTCALPAAAGHVLSLAERIAAQRALDEVYFAQSALSPAGRADLAASAELKSRRFVALAAWLAEHEPAALDAAALEREFDRIVRDSRAPARLRAIFAALGNDRFLVEECLVRPLLTERVAMRFMAPRAIFEADASIADLAARVEAPDLAPLSRAQGSVPEPAPSNCATDGTWNNASLDDFPEPMLGHTAVWTGSLMLVWGGDGARTSRHGWRYDPALDTWSPMTPGPFEEGRTGHSAVWTGSRMIVWGGKDAVGIGHALGTGAAYDPASDTWSALPTANAPTARKGHTAVWTGTVMIVWGGTNDDTGVTKTGARYDPAAGTWTATSTTGAAVARYGHVAQWTGNVMVVWGGNKAAGNPTDDLNSGGRYNPATDSWLSMRTAGSPDAASFAASVWTGQLVVVWGGGTPSHNTGGRYDPAADVWRATSLVNAPAGRKGHTAVWAGTRMLVYGGETSDGIPDPAVRPYDPLTDTWSKWVPAGAPSTRSEHSAVWTGSELIVWGGRSLDVSNDEILGRVPAEHSGARFAPAGPAWTPMAQSDGPGWGTPAVWVGGTMLFPFEGRAYDPVLDTWRLERGTAFASGNPTTAFVIDDTVLLASPTGILRYDLPRRRWIQRAGWNGSPSQFGAAGPHALFLVGGRNEMAPPETPCEQTYYDLASLYDLSTDTWHHVASAGRPAPRRNHAVVWTGTEFIVWGGTFCSPLAHGGAGARYNPATDRWTPMRPAPADGTAPDVTRCSYWTGSEFVTWPDLLRYRPDSDSWSAMSNDGAPQHRRFAFCTWTGRELLVWGGQSDTDGSALSDGARWNPVTDRWTPLGSNGAPSNRGIAVTSAAGTTSVWTGSEWILYGGSQSPGSLPSLASGARLALQQNDDNDGDGYSSCAGDCDDSNPLVHPGALESCNDRDDDCNGLVDETPAFDADHDGVPDCTDNCPLISNAAQSDADFDGAGDACDCAPADEAAFAVPQEVGGVRLVPGRIIWQLPFPGWGRYAQYEEVTGALGEWPVGSGTGEACSGRVYDTESRADVRPTPAAGRGWWYLERPVNACGNGSWGSQSDGTPRSRTCP